MGNLKMPNMYVPEVSGRGSNRKTLKKIMTNTFPNLIKTIYLHIQEAQ